MPDIDWERGGAVIHQSKNGECRALLLTGPAGTLGSHPRGWRDLRKAHRKLTLPR